MAINFPDSPSNDDIHTVGSQTFIYKSSIPGWQRQVSGVNLSSIARYTSTFTPPTSELQG